MSVRPPSARARHVVDLATVLVRRDLQVSYGSAVFGLLWAPAAMGVQAAVLGLVFVRVVPLGVEDYPAFLLTGLIAWQLVSSTLSGGTDAFTANRDLVRRPGFPEAVLPAVTTGRAVAAYALSLPLVLMALAVTGRLQPTALALPVVAAVSLLVLAGPVLVVATTTVRYRDVAHLLRILLGVAFYATPVFYAEESVPERYRWLIDANPLAGIVGLHRQVLYEGSWPDPLRLATLAGIGAAGLAVGLTVLRRRLDHLADEL